MENEEYLKYAVYLTNNGNKQEARRVFMVLVDSSSDEIKLQAIDGLLSLLDQIKDYDLIVRLCDKAIYISIAQRRLDNLAYFQIRKASTLSIKIGGWKYTRKMFKLSPNWFNFSTEAEEKKYNILDEKIKEGEKSVDILCGEAVKNAKLVNNKKLLGMVYLYRAPIWQNRCSDLKIEKMKYILNFLPAGRLRDILRYAKEDLYDIDAYFSKSISDLSTAMDLFKEVKDNDSILYCLNNLTNYYLNSSKYVQAFITFKKLEASIKGSKDKKLLEHFEVLRGRLMSLNRNVPNYVDEYQDYMSI